MEEQIETLIDAIENYNNLAPYIIILYIESPDEDMPDFYFAVMAALRVPTEDEMNTILWTSKMEVGNIIYAADYVVLKREKAIEYLENLI